MTVPVSAAPAAPAFIERHYTAYLVAIAFAGWALASYDFNLLVLTFPDISKSLHLSPGFVGLLGFIIYAAMFVITLLAGYGMDTRGRKWMWMFCLAAAAIFTGLTYFVENYWQLAVVRALASGFANSELAISVTLVNEQVSARRRGLLYSIVQGGWPVGVFLASGVYLLFHGLGWRTVFLFGIVPIVVVIIGRYWVRESDRYLHVQQIKAAKLSGDDRRMRELLGKYAVDTSEVEKVTVRQLFGTQGYVRHRLFLLTIVWLFYSTSYVATNIYITYWLTHYSGWSSDGAGRLLLVSGGIGFFFYVLGGLLGERFGRREVLVWSGILTGPLNLIFMFLHNYAAVAVVYFLIYQVTNGTWSGAGYAYWAECFPTRVRGTAIGWLGAMFTGGLIIGTALWTILISVTSHQVTWLVIAVILGFGEWTALLLPRIEPGQTLESIAT
ncbi:MAG TPA: MFS transporter [Acetobacteraceae bacterium]|nr:MFS transporter [Acetobacteraceae bacterium]